MVDNGFAGSLALAAAGSAGTALWLIVARYASSRALWCVRRRRLGRALTKCKNCGGSISEVARKTDATIPKGWWGYSIIENRAAIEKRVPELFRDRQALRNAFTSPYKIGPDSL